MTKVTTLNEYQEFASKTAIFPEGCGLSYCALGLNGEAGEVAEKIKKMLRDDDGKLSEEKRGEVKKELGDVMWYLSQMCRLCDTTMEEVAQMNIDKLYSRMERGKLKGSGDNR